MNIKYFLFQLIQPDPSKARYYVGVLSSDDLSLSDKERYAHIRWIKSETLKDDWIADPFILKVENGMMQVMAEQLYRGVGRLVLLDVDLSTMEILRLKVILQLPTHLSFPYIWRENGETFVMPENVESGELAIYRFDSTSEKLVERKVLIPEPLEDAQLCKIGEKYYIFGVRFVLNDYFLCTKYLEVYAADSLFGPYTHLETIENPLRKERGAGTIWHDGEGIIRPAQNCENGYGTNLLFYQLRMRTDGLFDETLVYEYHPDLSHPRSRAFHTFNEKDGYVVIDGNAWVNPRWSKFFYGVKEWMAAILKRG